jgi:flagellar biosynthetic protein FliQ
MTLTFVPKLAAIVIVFWLSMGFMTQALVAFFDGHIIPLIVGGS